MKKQGKHGIAAALVLTGLIGFHSQTAKAEYVNAYVDGTVWECEGSDIGSPTVNFYYFTEGTTVIDNTEYLNLYSRLLYSNSDSEKMLEGYVRFENGIVYFCNPTQDEKGAIFNFNLNAGDSTTISEWIGNYKYMRDVEVECTESYSSSTYGDNIEYKEIRRKDSSQGPYPNIWISGIGSESGPIHNLYADLLGGSSYVTKVIVNGKVIYDTSGSGISVPETETQIRRKDKVNLDGTPHIDGQKGIYIDRSGRKVID
ncbi:MAG: hypothetical protein HDS24_05250 [Bacteroides sp.]|nr:hypothetical protein [Bacteroides sp.]